jgi:hypothetical protein
MNRDEHLAWAKRRALEYVDAEDLSGAVVSMTSDLGKHEGFDKSVIAFMSMDGLLFCIPKGADAVRHWIEGFN